MTGTAHTETPERMPPLVVTKDGVVIYAPPGFWEAYEIADALSADVEAVWVALQRHRKAEA